MPVVYAGLVAAVWPRYHRGMVRLVAVALSLALVACAAPSADDVAPPAPDPITHRIDSYQLAPGAEQTNRCVSWTLGNTETLYVNAVALDSAGGFHHSNWFWVPEDSYPGDDGTWRCSDRNYDEALAAAMGGVLFAQTTQAVDETQAFPPGVVIVIPPRAKIVAGVHLLNASDGPLDTYLDLTLTPIAPADVTVRLAALSLTYEALALPPGRTSSFTVECPLADRFEQIVGGPLDLNVYYALPHYHELGRRIEIVAGGGPRGDVTVFETESAIGEPAGAALSPAFSLRDFRTLRFSCTFDNPRAQTVRWGVGDQEMCVMLAFIDGSLNWGGGVLQRSNPGTPVDDGGVVQFSQPCELYGFPAHQE